MDTAADPEGPQWELFAASTDPDWEMPAASTGTARSVEFRRGDQPRSAIIFHFYPAWYDKPGEFWVKVLIEWIVGEDPADLVGTAIWSVTGDDEISAGGDGEAPGQHQSEESAARMAQHLAALLTRGAYDDLDAIEPLLRDELEWDGIPFRHPGETFTPEAFHANPCPACGNPVPLAEDAVWTCPANLSEDNPDRLPPDPQITSELQDQAGVYSNCGEHCGFACYEDLPLHAACYDARPY